MTENQESRVAALDKCIDELLSGCDWHDAVVQDVPPDVIPLVEVAGRVLRAARETGAPRPGHRMRLWTRVRRSMEAPGSMVRRLGALLVRPIAWRAAPDGFPSPG